VCGTRAYLSIKNPRFIACMLLHTAPHRTAPRKRLEKLCAYSIRFFLSPCFAIYLLSRHTLLTRVPRDLISDILRMVSCITSAARIRVRVRARREIAIESLNELISIQCLCLRFHFFSPFDVFYIGSHRGWMGSS